MGAANLAPPSDDTKSSDPPETGDVASNPTPVPSSSPPLTSGSDAETDDTLEVTEEEQQSSAKSEMITQNTLALEAQVEERPLAKKQEQLDHDGDAEGQNGPSFSESNGDGAQNGVPNEEGEAGKPKHHRKALLKNDDFELRWEVA